jgi:hypothetical protein
LACTAVSPHNIHKSNHAGRVQEGGTGTICFEDITEYIKKSAVMKMVLDDEAGSCLGLQQDITHESSGHITPAKTRISTPVHHTSNSVATSSQRKRT